MFFLSVINANSANWISLLYPKGLEIKETIFLDIDLKFATNDNVFIIFYAIINCPLLDSNTPTVSACGVYISELVRYAPDYIENFYKSHTIKSRVFKESSHMPYIPR